MLSILSAIYGRIIALRNVLYDRGVFEVHNLDAHTVSIGNITTGGTGKTPLVAYVAELLAARGEKVCILTRGYGRENAGDRALVSDGSEILADVSTAGDEPYELAQKLLGKAIVIADADRVSAAEWAIRKFGATAFVLDDGFQHRKAGRDVDTVCIDATNPFGGGKVLPAGRLREPVENLKRADIVVITRANLVSTDEISSLKSEISNLNGAAAIFECENTIVRVTPLKEFPAKTQRTQSRNMGGAGFAFCAVGNPDAFFDQLRSEGVELAGLHGLADHYKYAQADISGLEKEAASCGATCLMTTAKDAVKLSNFTFEIPCFVVESEVRLDEPERFAAML